MHHKHNHHNHTQYRLLRGMVAPDPVLGESVHGNTDTHTRHAHTANSIANYLKSCYLKSSCKRYKNHSGTGYTNYYERESRRASRAQTPPRALRPISKLAPHVPASDCSARKRSSSRTTWCPSKALKGSCGRTLGSSKRPPAENVVLSHGICLP